MGLAILAPMAMARTYDVDMEDFWLMNDTLDVLRSLTSALVARLDDHDLLVKLNERSQLTFSRVDQLVTSIEEKQDDLDSRVRGLEQARWMMLGGAMALGTVGSVIGWLLTLAFKHQ